MRKTLGAFFKAIGIVALGAANGAAARNTSRATHNLATLDAYVQGWTDSQKFSGVVLLAQGDEVVFEKAYGIADEKTERSATTGTRYNLASAGKMFTTVAVLQQIAKGRISFDTKLGDVLKNYPNHAMAQATVRQLLTHTSGAGDIDLFGTENETVRQRVHTVADMVALHSSRDPEFTPGSKQEYGNFAYVLLGRMVELLSGEDYESYVTRHIFQPAGMTHTGFVDCTTDASDIAAGYAVVGGKRVRNCATQPVRGLPAGGELSTAHDMFLFTRALRRGTLIPTSLLSLATKPYREFMGLGFFATDYGPSHAPEDLRWGHGGSSDGECTDVRVYPKTGETVVVLSNEDPPACFAVVKYPHEHRGTPSH